jgi:endonuclease YncB( thermonuclease family)
MVRIALTLLLLLQLALAQKTIVGVASVIDGDTLEIQGNKIRLYGIDAPEAGQLCLSTTATKYRCGQQAANRLAEQTYGRTITCQVIRKDQYGRFLAVCKTNDRELNEWMVKNGWAVAEYATDYIRIEQTAKLQHINLWAGKFQRPKDFRRSPSAISRPTPAKPKPKTVTRPRQPSTATTRQGIMAQPDASVYYANCTAARAAGVAPIYVGEPGYRPRLDRDGDGTACE